MFLGCSAYSNYANIPSDLVGEAAVIIDWAHHSSPVLVEACGNTILLDSSPNVDSAKLQTPNLKSQSLNSKR